MVRSARYLGNSCKHGDADADRKQQGTRPSEARVSLVQVAVKSGHDRVEQPGYLPCGRCRPRAGRAREQKTLHEGDDRVALSTQTDSTTHHQLTLPGMLGHPHEQRVGRICPCQHVERPGVLHRRATYGTAYPPPLHPAAQPRTSGQRFDPVAADTIPAHLHRTDGRNQSRRVTSTPQLSHFADRPRVESEHICQPTLVARCEFEVEGPRGRGLQRAVSEQAPTADSVQAGVTVEPGR